MARDKKTEVTVAHILLEVLTSDNPNKRIQLVSNYVDRNLRKGLRPNETVIAKSQDKLCDPVSK